MTPQQRATQAIRGVVDEVRKPLPKWVGVAGLVLVAVGAVGHDAIVTSFGGGKFGVWAASAIPVLGAVFSTLAHSLGGTGGKSGN
jgi:uncharacterized protein YqgC (DUF456 family)